MQTNLTEWTERTKLSEKWINGIKKSWKRVVAEAEKTRGTRSAHKDDLSWWHITENTEKERRYWKTVRDYIDALRDELLIKRGFWDRPLDPEVKKELGKIPEVQMANEKISTAFANIYKEIDEAINYMDWLQKDTDPKHKGLPHPGYLSQTIYKDPNKFKETLTVPHAKTKEIIKKVDSLVSRQILRLAKKRVKEFGWEEISTIPSEPAVNHVAGFTIIFQDLPPAPEQDTKKHEKMGWGRPAARTRLLKTIKNACMMLRRHGMKKLCYGKITVLPGMVGRNRTDETGQKFSAAADYTRQGDLIRVFSPYVSPDAIVHEIGHRYYYKYMSTEDRNNFDKWFGKVPAVRQYGGTAPWEDFATAFEAYVTGQGMTKSQRARFEQFLGRKRKLESTRPPRLSQRLIEAMK